MAKKGGYQILDLGGHVMTSGSESIISGTYSAIQNANGKRIVVSGLTVSGDDSDTEYADFEAYFVAGENTYEAAVTLNAASMTITVDYGDDVTVTLAQADEP